MAVVFAAPAVAACPAAVSGRVTGPVFTTGACDFSVAGGGAISGGSTGVINQVSIGSLANSGTVTGSIYGINNRFAPINQPHVIVWSASAETPGTMGAVMNTGVITGGLTGIANAGAIGSLINNGLIGSRLPSGDFSGITNYGTIGALDNTAEIFASAEGIFNGGLIETLSNSGTISGPMTGPSYATGIKNAAVITQLTNTGVIAGANDGIYSSGTIAALFNSGTIAGGRDGLALAAGEATNMAGGVIKGAAAGAVIGTPPVSAGTSGSGVSGGLTNGGSIGTLTNSGSMASGVIVNTFSNAAVHTNAATQAPGAAIVINDGVLQGIEGAAFTGAGNTLVNAGTIISTTGGTAIDFGTAGQNFLTLTTGSFVEGTIYGGGTAGQITLDGNGAMNNQVAGFGAGSGVEIAPGADWTASGNWHIASVTNDGVFQPGIAGAGLNLAGNFVQNADGTLRVLVSPAASPFATTHFVIAGTASLAGGVKYYFAPGTYKAGSVDFITATGGITGGFSSASYNLPPAGLLGQTLISGANGALSFAALTIAPLNDSIFSDEIQSGAAQAQLGNAALLAKATAGDAANAGSCGPQSAAPQGQASVQKIASAVAGAICGAGGWFQATGTAMRAYGNTDVSGYGANTAGFLAGISRAVNNAGLRLGVAVGYDETALRSGGGKGTVDTTRVGLFVAQPLGRFTVAGDFMFGASSTATNRATGAGEAKSGHAGDVFSGGLQVSTVMQLHGVSLTPTAGLRIAVVNAGGFDETGYGFAAPFTVSGARLGYDSVQPFVTLDISRAFLTPSGVAVTPDASLGYVYEAGARSRAVALQARDGTPFASQDIALAGSAAQASAGISAGQGMWSLYARYSAQVGGNWVSQTGEAGLRVRF
jgi:hypothetical protein